MAEVCSIHGVPFKIIPAGVAKATQRPYPAFEACPVTGCREKPQAPLNASEPLDRVIMDQKENEAIKRDKERSYRIERQHSQSAAVAFLGLLNQSGQLKEITSDLVTKYTDHFMQDLDLEEVTK